MTFSPLKLDLNEYGTVSGQLYQPEALPVGQHDRGGRISKDARLVILLHGWGADGSDLAPLAPSLLGPVSVVPEDISSANHSSFSGAVACSSALIYVLQTLWATIVELSDLHRRRRNASARQRIYCGMLNALCMRRLWIRSFWGLLARWHGIAFAGLATKAPGFLSVWGMADLRTDLARELPVF